MCRSKEGGREGGSDAALLETGEGCDPADGAVCREEAVIVKNVDDGTGSRPYGHCLVCGVDRCGGGKNEREREERESACVCVCSRTEEDCAECICT